MHSLVSPSPSWNPVKRVQARFRRWWQARMRPSDSHTLTQRNVYILPTAPGFVMAATLLVLLIASINYQLNLGYVLTFMLAGSAVVGMHICHGNLRGLTLQITPPTAQFMGQNAMLDIRLISTRSSPRHGIGVSVIGNGHWAWTDVPAQATASLQVAWKAPRRGLLTLPPLTAETRFPMGTFRVWTVWQAASPLLVYPQAEVMPPPLPPGEPRSQGAGLRRGGSGEFDSVRAYRRGDPLKTVVWKKSAKALADGSDNLVSRDDQQQQSQELWLDFAHCGLPDTESRLSRLCAWVLEADKRGAHFGLRLPNRQIAPGQGESHKRQCLEALALC